MSKYKINQEISGDCSDCKKKIKFIVLEIEKAKNKEDDLELYVGRCPICSYESVHYIACIN